MTRLICLLAVLGGIALVTARVEADPGPLAALLQVVVAPYEACRR